MNTEGSIPEVAATAATASADAAYPPDPAHPSRPRIATVSLAGCFGCHMSFMDIDERLFELVDLVRFDRSPLTDIKSCGPCEIGLIEGGLCNAENVHVLREFRRNCRTLVAVGACAINGGLPAQRNAIPVREILQEVYLTGPGPGVLNAQVPNDPELPLVLDKVYPIHEVVRVDYAMPGCPPSGDTIWAVLVDLLAGRAPKLAYSMIHYD